MYFVILSCIVFDIGFDFEFELKSLEFNKIFGVG